MLLTGLNPLNAKARGAKIAAQLDRFIPSVAKMDTQMKKFTGTLKGLLAESEGLTAENSNLREKSKSSIIKQLRTIQLQRDYDAAVSLIVSIPTEVMEQYRQRAERSVVHER